MRRLVWFSCGAASAVAAKLAATQYGARAEIVYCDTLASEHIDNARFLQSVSVWCGRPITTLHSDRYADVDDVFRRRRYLSGPAGAPCTVEMKKKPREAYQRHDDIHIFGYTADEEDRIERFEAQNPELHVEWILRNRGLTKKDCLAMLTAAGLVLPAMYSLGFEHNNCLGCVKATSPAYWNKVRQHFPAVFEKRVKQSRLYGTRLVRHNGKRIFLDELPPDTEEMVFETIDCGPVCLTP